mgnify:CR=1 FL=1
MFNIFASLMLFVISAFVFFMQLVFPISGIDGVIIYLAAIASCIGSLSLYNIAHREYILSKLMTEKFGK